MIVLSRDILEPTSQNLEKYQELWQLDEKLGKLRSTVKTALKERERLLTVNYVLLIKIVIVLERNARIERTEGGDSVVQGG